MTKGRPKGYSDLDILWAIRGIPSFILNSQRKGILSMFLAIIGNKEGACYSMIKLENKLGLSARRQTEHFTYLENLNFLIIERPDNYVKGDVNHYSLNYEQIIAVANEYKEFSRDKH